MKTYEVKNILFCIVIFVFFNCFSFAENTLTDKALKYKKVGDWKNAEMLFLALLEKNSNCSECYFHLGEIEENKLNYGKASIYYKKASVINPRYYARLGYCYQTILRWEKSVDAFKKYLNSFPGEEKVSEALGISYRKTGNLKNSEIIFKNILKNNSKNIVSLFNLSQIYSAKDDDKNAKLYFEKYTSVSELKSSQDR